MAEETQGYYDLQQPVFGITADTTDEEIKKIAGGICYRAGIAMNRFVESTLQNQRETARLRVLVESLRNQLAAQGQPPHMANVERRGHTGRD